MPTRLSTRPRQRVPKVLAILGRTPRPVTGRPRTEFDSSDPAGLVQRLDASDCFCCDTKVGRLYHRRDVSFRELSQRDSLHVTVRDGRTVTTHVDRHSPLARRQTGGDCRYSPLRIAAHNLTGAARDLARLIRREGHGIENEHEPTLVDDGAVAETLADKESGTEERHQPDSVVTDQDDVTDLRRGPPSRQAAREAPRRGPR